MYIFMCVYVSFMHQNSRGKLLLLHLDHIDIYISSINASRVFLGEMMKNDEQSYSKRILKAYA